ncbi:MAG: hypothetical protein IKC67_04045 [Odoribacter sp.]|nr:hypothetical protein [Bacteroidales bacterium]MBR2981276.1 hypothetical protein [Odoribacter sp.]
MLPKFLFADNSQFSTELVYVVHTEKPRCIIQCGIEDFDDDNQIFWIDEEPSPEDIEELLDMARDFYEATLDNEDELEEYDD